MLFQITLVSLYAICTARYTGCPPNGPLLPRPNLSNSVNLKNATTQLEIALQDAISGKISSGFDVSNSSYSIGLVSQDSPKPFWSFHHRGDANVNGSKIDGDTQYLIGSISKLLTDMMILRSNIDPSTPVLEYLPQLDNNSHIAWANITLDSLSDHLSGIPPNYGFSEFYFVKQLLQQVGFPDIPDSEYPSCGVTGLNGPCSAEDILQGVANLHPVSLPGQRPVYSNLAFTLLYLALKAKTGKDLRQLLNEYIITPFNLNNTGVSPGNDSRAAIPAIPNSWGSQYGHEDAQAPAGGYYSSINDFSTIVHSILTKKALKTETDARNWLKPTSATSSPNTLVGRPWEIFRISLTPEHPHTVDIYEKNGGAYGYTAQTGLIDQYGIGIIIFTAGPPETYRILYDAVLSTTIQAIEDDTRAQANRYVGTFTNNLVQMNISLDNGPGLKLNSLTRNGSDILAGIAGFFENVLPQFGKLSTDFRLFPADIEVKNGGEIREDWRIGFDFLPNTKDSGSDLPGQGAHADFCGAWQTQDWLYYGGEAIDRVVFVLDEIDRDIMGVEIPFLRANLSMTL